MSETSRYRKWLLIARIFWILILLAISLYLYFLYKPYIDIPRGLRHFNLLLHSRFKPSGSTGHLLGILGMLFIFLSYILYFLRKHIERFECLGPLSLWLEVHIFFGILGPILIFFHSAYDLTGFIGISFWLMLIIIISGIFGRILFGYCFWGISKIYEPLHLVDIFIEKDIRAERGFSQIVRRIMDMRSPGFPCTLGLIESIGQWRNIKRETGDLMVLINEKYDDMKYQEYEELHKKGEELIQKLREIRFVSVLDLYLSILNKWEFIHKACSYILFIMAILHTIVTVYWGYRWIF